MKCTGWIFSVILCFLLGIQDGHIALWKEGTDEPIEVFPFRAEMLPLADRIELEKKIKISSCEELAHLMEDYLS